jgi:alpha-glucosidase
LPIPAGWERLTVERQRRDPGSMLTLYRRAIRLRREHPSLTGDDISWVDAPPGCVAFRREPSGLTCVLNASAAAVPLPAGEPVLASAELPGELLPADTAVWLLPRP